MWPYHPGVLHLSMEERVKKWPHLPLIEGNKVINPKVSGKDQEQLTKQYTERAVSFIEKNKENSEIKNIDTILGTEKSVEIPKNSVDKILMVDVYHEFSFPVEMIASMKSALKSNGELFLIEYRAEDPLVPIKTIHKMSEKQAIKEMETAGFKLRKNIDNLPWQHCMIFEKNQ